MSSTESDQEKKSHVDLGGPLNRQGIRADLAAQSYPLGNVGEGAAHCRHEPVVEPAQQVRVIVHAVLG